MKLPKIQREVLLLVVKNPGQPKSFYTYNDKLLNNYSRVQVFNAFNKLLNNKYVCVEYTNTLIYFPNNDSTPDGLWLVNPRTGVMIRPKNKIDTAFGKNKVVKGKKFIILPEGVFELVDGFQYGSRTYRDSSRTYRNFSKKRKYNFRRK